MALLPLAILLLGAAPAATAPAADTGIVVNGQPLAAARRQALESAYRTRLRPGDYWYDRRSGLWGLRGGPALGVIAPSLDLGGPLAADASGGDTGVYLNGRQLHRVDVAFLQTLGPVLPGRYWLDALGNVGVEGTPMPFVNLLALARQRPAGRDNFWSNGSSAFNSEGGCTYFNSRDAGGTVTSASVGC